MESSNFWENGFRKMYDEFIIYKSQWKYAQRIFNNTQSSIKYEVWNISNFRFFFRIQIINKIIQNPNWLTMWMQANYDFSLVRFLIKTPHNISISLFVTSCGMKFREIKINIHWNHKFNHWSISINKMTGNICVHVSSHEDYVRCT